MMYFGHIQPLPTLPRSLLSPYSYTILFSFYFMSINSNLYYPYTFGYRGSHWSLVIVPVATPLKKTFSSQQL